MNWKKLIVLIIAAAGLSACASPERLGQYHGEHRRICSPVDAVGTEFSLARSEGAGPARARLAVWRAVGDDPQSLTLRDPDRQGQLSLCDSSGDCEPVRAAVHLTLAADADGRIHGRVRWRAGLSQRSLEFVSSVAPEPGPICG